MHVSVHPSVLSALPSSHHSSLAAIVDGVESEERFEGEDYQLLRFQDGEEINYLIYSIEEFETYDAWCEENEPPENQTLVTAFKEYFANL